jgi:hypothetical protein
MYLMNPNTIRFEGRFIIYETNYNGSLEKKNTKAMCYTYITIPMVT